ncbi:TPA: aspartate--tRNA(Asn) ligase [Candidatus Uhrbacteria bacterium]|nr:aspartate--tRNA(Asn) ligase [Candidatus Uhrbacteria bacterium]
MLQRTLIGLLSPEHEGQNVRVCGWVEHIRNKKQIVFLVIRDQTGSVQVTYIKSDGTAEWTEHLEGLTLESAVDITGRLVKNPHVKLGEKEIIPESITVVGLAEKPIPLGIHPQLQDRLDWRFLDLRTPQQRLIFEIQTTAEHAMRQWWMDQGFLEIHSPKLMGHGSESGAELFSLPYFGTTAYLAQSPQFYKQMAMAAGFDRVFEIGPVFRANPSFTSRHDTEFTSVDVEVAWIDSHDDVMQVEEKWVTYFLGRVAEECGQRLKKLYNREVVIPSLPFPRIPMAHVHEILAEMGHIIPPETGGDLDPEGERLICKWVKEHHGHEFVFVTDWPIGVRPFYHMRHAEHPNLTKSFDLLWNGLEVTSGAQREHRYDILRAQAIEKGLDPSPIQFYLDFFRFGMPPHGGFGFGLTRMLMLLTGVMNVREVTYLYRGPNRLTP